MLRFPVTTIENAKDKVVIGWSVFLFLFSNKTKNESENIDLFKTQKHFLKIFLKQAKKNENIKSIFFFFK